ncbi:MAG: nitrite reductase large subunit NirB [Candidatus Omnitrophota bacterium]|nr:nitrite reductase large subunit NirB [Candidatus Omnitrophota bacterium]
MSDKKHLVVVGNGMAGMACLSNILKRQPNFVVTVLSEEPYCNYNRILLSSVLSGEKPEEDIYINTEEWYEKNNICLRLGTKAVDINAKTQNIICQDGSLVHYDKLLIATGSDPFIPPIDGVKKRGVYTFRNLADTRAILEQCRAKTGRAVVIGGGLLGLEAARGLLNQGMKVSVVHIMDRLMERQVDEKGGWFLKREFEKMGIDVLLKRSTARIMGDKDVDGVLFKDGEIIGADMVVVACGIRPNVALGKKAGLQVNRGIVVNDYMETNNPDIFAVGECVEHRGMVYGLVAPLWDQGKVLAATITGDKGPTYEGSVLATKLKVMGIELFSAGEFMPEEPEKEVVAYEDHAFGIYKKLVVKNERLVGAILIGDSSDANRFLDMIRKNERVSGDRHRLLFETPPAVPGSPTDVMSKPDTETICGCIGVSKGQIVSAIREDGCRSVQDIKKCTKASTGCGTCTGLVEQILRAVAGSEVEEVKEKVVCECIPFPKEKLRNIIKTQNLKSVQDVLEVYGNGTGCLACKPALGFIVDEVWCGDHEEQRSARFINDRVHANIQRDGTFSVIPRMRGGVTSPAQLRKIADVAEKYKVPMVKVTGSQRIDLLGVKKEDLPKMWADLDMTSGYAYAKAVRMVKSCVGTDFCRFGTQNSIQTGIDLETALEGLHTPAKVKLGVVGCPRNCAEATVKDIGLVGIEGGWQVVIGGAAGKTVRAADILLVVETKEQAFEAAFLFFQYYRENGEYLERTYDFVERLGLEKIRQETILASDEKKRGLLERLKKSKSKVVNPWNEHKKPVHPMQFDDFVLPKDKEALIGSPS